MGFRGFDRTIGVNACRDVVLQTGCAGCARRFVRSSKHVQGWEGASGSHALKPHGCQITDVCVR